MTRGSFLKGGTRSMLFFSLVGLCFYFLCAFLISLIPHQLAFNYDRIEVAQANQGQILKYRSVLEYRNAGGYTFKDTLFCDFGDGLERVELAVTEGHYDAKVQQRRVVWTWRESNPFIIPEGTTYCVLESRIIYKWLGVLPLTQKYKLEHEVDF